LLKIRRFETGVKTEDFCAGLARPDPPDPGSKSQALLVFSPKSEIQTGKMTQYLGAETNRKNRGIPKVVCRDSFNSFMPKRLRQIAGFNFGFRV
jgi:hypothetical protein